MVQPGAGTRIPPCCPAHRGHCAQIVVRISCVAGSDAWLEKSERVIPACSRVGGPAGFASMQVRNEWRAGSVWSLNATGSMASSCGLFQEQCLLFPGNPGVLGASAGSVLCLQSKWGCSKLRLSLMMACAMPRCVLPGFLGSSLTTTSGFATGLAPSPPEAEEKEEMKAALWGRPQTAPCASACPIALDASLFAPQPCQFPGRQAPSLGKESHMN